MAIRMQTNLRIISIGMCVYKQIIVARRDVHVRRKAFVLKKKRLFIGHVTPNPHIRHTFEGKRQVINCSKKGFKADQRV
ncbi:hypothetical protein D3C85_980480 [compost metagenome]